MARNAAILVAAACVLAVASAAPAFVSIGDWGGAALEDYHRTDELAVAKQFGTTAGDLDAMFVVNVGDNFCALVVVPLTRSAGRLGRRVFTAPLPPL